MDDLSSLSLADIARLAEAHKLPPVEKWQPIHCGDSAMRIARDGTWYHEGSPIGRPEMVRLFSTILRREPDGGFVLVTPAEKLDIIVEDAPFVAVELKSEGEGEARTLAFRLNTGDAVIAGPDHALRFKGDSYFSAQPGQADAGLGKSNCPHPYLHVRAGLDALVARPVYYELAELALGEGSDPAGLWSGGAFFPFEPAP
ncbi:MAG: uncharacterized protein QOG13_1794 [Sphingomonadales bacterium]|jgi:hypothetical protein|nr:uncharacterized protein [Sphingomonadales bacterium]MEA3045223.1 uncharacterized protein [Sphingomonadales bacterium]